MIAGAVEGEGHLHFSEYQFPADVSSFPLNRFTKTCASFDEKHESKREGAANRTHLVAHLVLEGSCNYEIAHEMVKHNAAVEFDRVAS
jgi:hypothetical protein